jgi:hypothetical protein
MTTNATAASHSIPHLLAAMESGHAELVKDAAAKINWRDAAVQDSAFWATFPMAMLPRSGGVQAGHAFIAPLAQTPGFLDALGRWIERSAFRPGAASTPSPSNARFWRADTAFAPLAAQALLSMEPAKGDWIVAQMAVALAGDTLFSETKHAWLHALEAGRKMSARQRVEAANAWKLSVDAADEESRQKREESLRWMARAGWLGVSDLVDLLESTLLRSMNDTAPLAKSAGDGAAVSILLACLAGEAKTHPRSALWRQAAISLASAPLASAGWQRARAVAEAVELRLQGDGQLAPAGAGPKSRRV